jgi:hypothetical protein
MELEILRFGSEFIKAEALVKFLHSLQLLESTSFITLFCARRTSSTRSSLETNRAIFNQIRLNYHCNLPNTPDLLTVTVPTAHRVVSSPFRPKTPAHVGEHTHDPFCSDWKGSLFENYEKMQLTGTFSAPMSRSQVPPGKAVLHSCIAFCVKDGDTPHSYDLCSHLR